MGERNCSPLVGKTALKESTRHGGGMPALQAGVWPQDGSALAPGAPAPVCPVSNEGSVSVCVTGESIFRSKV